MPINLNNQHFPYGPNGQAQVNQGNGNNPANINFQPNQNVIVRNHPVPN